MNYNDKKNLIWYRESGNSHVCYLAGSIGPAFFLSETLHREELWGVRSIFITGGVSTYGQKAKIDSRAS